MESTIRLIRNLVDHSKETPWLEFKHNNADADEIGQYISALGNSATCYDRDNAYLIWGVDDSTHEIVGTSFDPYTKKIGNEELENWLRHHLSDNAIFTFNTATIDSQNVVVLEIEKALRNPITFKKEAYIRSGSYKKKLRDIPALETKLWSKLSFAKYETIRVKEDLSKSSIMSLLNYVAYFDLTGIQQPNDIEQVLHYLLEDNILQKQDNGCYAITNLGALLFAKRLSDFPTLSRKCIRVIQYTGASRTSTKSDMTFEGGYAASFEEIIRYVEGSIPNADVIVNGIRSLAPPYPAIIIREVIANALIHQDFIPSGVGPMVEIFENRVEVTNPGSPLVEINRIVDNPPKSRNEMLAALMRRFGICEERGSGWDKIVEAAEMARIPVPRIHIYDEFTRVNISSFIPLGKMSADDRIWACYLHACLKYASGDSMNNASLRERFGMESSDKVIVSRVIKMTVKEGLIKPLDEKTAPRYMQYIPYWV